MPQHSAESSKEQNSGTRPGVSRRAMLRGAAGAGVAVGVGAGAVVIAGSGPAGSAQIAGTQLQGPVVAHVLNAGTGQIAVYSGDQQIIIHDRDLAARLTHATA